jgi:hypothetical protein
MIDRPSTSAKIRNQLSSWSLSATMSTIGRRDMAVTLFGDGTLIDGFLPQPLSN